MCHDFRSSFPSSSSPFTLLSTPPTLHFDQRSINDGSVSDQETILDSPTDSLFHGIPPERIFSSVTQENPRSKSPRKGGKRTTSSNIISPPSSPIILPVRKKIKMDMNMAKAGSMAAASAFQTPLATYVAQMVVWLWYGEFSPSPQLPPSSPLSSSPIPNDPFDVAHASSSRISTLMVQPSPQFSKFVSRMLTLTSVSHSVTIVALLYVYRLKMRNTFFSTPGSEQRPFIAGLMLGNKYLDDNTYTNATWAELAGMSLPDINKMESEFLGGLNYQLGVPVEEYQRWKNLLDGFMTSRAPSSALGRHIRRVSAGKSPLSTTTINTPTLFDPIPSMYRARSASPPRIQPPHHSAGYAFPPGCEHARKRSAVDASMHDPESSAAIYESLRMPSRKAGFTQPLQSTQHLQPTLSVVSARPATAEQAFGTSSSNRSSSLSRQQGRLVPQKSGTYGRRGSVGHTLPTSVGLMSQQPSPDTGDVPMFSSIPAEWNGGRALLAPYENQAQLQHVPPEHMMFYSLAAAPHPGADGAPRKAILRYQEPQSFPYSYQNPPYASTAYPVPPSATTPSYLYEDVTMYDANNSPQTAYPTNAYQYPPIPIAHPGQSVHSYGPGMYDTYQMPVAWSPTHAFPEPAQFANAGPPGFSYIPSEATWKNPSLYGSHNPAMIGLGLNTNISTTSTPGMGSNGQTSHDYNGAGYHTPAGMAITPVNERMLNQWGSRSEWSSPMFPRYG
ncbi:uncharacterized protein IL334_000637 [Kwoniella shivajii]|uniref:Cyclin n=1 Tax=Kwoniella shivajii TaxID=564305 RepID=A0ABZ1CPP3_9TREE|nr:hypothetical protein IL334_000637 [Kwoniella shivajii]